MVNIVRRLFNLDKQNDQDLEPVKVPPREDILLTKPMMTRGHFKKSEEE